jgi:rod shape-determining protein MreC
MEYSPPPLFKQGASARVKMIVFAMIAIALLMVDSRMRTLGTIRQTIGTVLYPLQRVALVPRGAASAVASYFSSLSHLQDENDKLKNQRAVNAEMLQQSQQLVAENAQLRRLLGAGERIPVKTLMSEILYDARDPFTRKIIVDRGGSHGVEAGQPVIDDTGVVGQVTTVFPFASEVTLLTDKDQAIPVQVVRSGLRSVAYGQGHSGALDLRFMPANADIKNGDILVTSGIDGVYPAGLAVAKVTQVESKSNDAFARIVCLPLAGIDRNRQLLILLKEENPAFALAAERGASGKEPAAASTTPTAKHGTTGAAPAAATHARSAAQTPTPKAPAAPGPASPAEPPASPKPGAAERAAAPRPSRSAESSPPATPAVPAAPAQPANPPTANP